MTTEATYTSTRRLKARCLNPNDMARVKACCSLVGVMRKRIWQKYGALGTVGRTVGAICTEIKDSGLVDDLEMDKTTRNESAKDIVNDIFAYRAASEKNVREDIAKRYSGKDAESAAERKKKYKLLRDGKWLTDNFLHRKMRRHFKHGIGHADNQFVIRSDKFLIYVENGRCILEIRWPKDPDGNIKLELNSNGKNLHLVGHNLRVIVKDDEIYIHYAFERKCHRGCGNSKTGLDKGFTEGGIASNGMVLAKGLGKLIRDYVESRNETVTARNKLLAIAIKHKEQGDIETYNNIMKNNLGTKKLNHRLNKFQSQVRNIFCKDLHTLMDSTGVLVAEDLAQYFKGKNFGAKMNRWLANWVKGDLQDCIKAVTTLRGCQLELVNAAYTSQIDAQTGVLSGQRKGDRFYRETGDVVQADINAALVIAMRADDPEISRYMPHTKVKEILDRRTKEYRETVAASGGRADNCYWPSKDSSWMRPHLEQARKILAESGKKIGNK